jgi:DNA-binding transcriptional MerR regulator
MFQKSYATISEFATIHKVSRQTLIYYDKLNLFKPAYVNPANGYRYYAPHQHYEFDTIQTFTEMNAPLKEVRSYIRKKKDPESYFALQRAQVEALSQRIREYELRIANTRNRIREYEAYMASPREGAPFVCTLPERLVTRFQLPYSNAEFMAHEELLYPALYRLDLPILFGWGGMCESSNPEEFNREPVTIFYYDLDLGRPENEFIRPKGDYLVLYTKGISDNLPPYDLLGGYARAHGLSLVGAYYTIGVVGLSVVADPSEMVIKTEIQVIPQ